MSKKFKFKGYPNLVTSKRWVPILEIRIPLKNGKKHVIKATDPVFGIMPSSVIEIPDDERAIRHMKVNPHFDEVQGPPV